MHPIELFIANLNNDKDKNIKQYHQLMAATIWSFALRIAEKLFLYADDATEYAKKILFMELNTDFGTILSHVKSDLTTQKIAFDDTEMYNLFIDSYTKSQEYITCNQNIDFYN
jgi:hypothetical protein